MGNHIEWSSIASGDALARPHFGDPRLEWEAVRDAVVVTPASGFQLLLVHGDDAAAFLQGQLTCDVDQVTPARAQFGGYCTPKGRLLATFVLLRVPRGYLMLLPADVAPGIAARLRKFVLRSKVVIDAPGGWRALGLAGPRAVELLARELSAAPATAFDVASRGDTTVVRLPDSLFVVCAPADAVGALWQRLSAEAVPAGDACWALANVRAGIPWISTAVQDTFLPQMVGLEAIGGGVSFEKGCYPGQEIVARARYLGEVKRKPALLSTPGSAKAGDTLHAAGATAGTVVSAAPCPGEGTLLLAVLNDPAGNAPLALGGGEPVQRSPAPAR